ncbi:hypothetical protein BKA82DRAFT_3980550 [Pisolithus tinctorius]|nr:hypothetical protein BKA82DRAFT_3980550 [Pisolithus tinctorius]
MTGAYLLEEKIECDGDFTKFIHNCDCVPLLNPDEEGYDIAEFLCFTQHVQYIKTKGLVYIANYQGMCSFVTCGMASILILLCRESNTAH